MRLMDDHEQPEDTNAELLAEETSEPASPSTPAPAQIRLNCVLRLTTMFNHHRVGKVIAFDPLANLVTLHIRGSKSHLTSIALINLHHCREWTVEEGSADEPADPLYPIDVNKLKKRQMDNEMEKRREASLINLKASRLGQGLFRDLRRIMNEAVRWSNNDILINNTVRIVEPYRVENISIDPTTSTNMKNSIKADNDTKTHLMKLVERFWSDPARLASHHSSTSADNPAGSSTLTKENAEGDTADSIADPSTSV